METIKITTDNKISIIDLDFKNYKAIQKEIGGHFETVKTKRLLDYFKAPVIMLVDEEGIIKGLPFNTVASGFYGTDEHGSQLLVMRFCVWHWERTSQDLGIEILNSGWRRC